MSSDSELNKFLYLLINIAPMVHGTRLSRRVFAVFAAFGMLGHLGHLSRQIFQDSLMFPVAVASIGIGIIFLGVVWQRNEQRLNELTRRALPAPVRYLVTRVHQ